MSILDGTATTAVGARVIKPVFFAYLDIVDDPVRANTSGHDVTPSGTGDADLDSVLYSGIAAQLVDVSEVKNAEGGSESLIIELSGLPFLDADMLATIGDPANWQGRMVRLWKVVRNASNVQQGGYHNYYNGYMMALDLLATPESQTIRLTIETYLAAFSQASNRTYLDQERYDAGDLSAKAAIAIANGVSGNPLTGNVYAGDPYGIYGGGFSRALEGGNRLL